MDAIYIEDLRKSFGTVKALTGLSMRVEEGTVCGFIGPNGAGKTTTLRVLLGLLAKDSGTVRLLGQDVVFGREIESRDRLSYLPQDPVFPERHTGLEVMRLVAALYRMDPRLAGERTETLLKEFHLWDSRRRSVATYSRGMKQRLGLATCFLPEPGLLVLDEPVSALDPAGRVEVFDLLRRLKGKSTVLFSSHILEDVERVSDKLVMVKAGRNIVEGPMEEILARYASDRLRVVFKPEDMERAERALAAMPWVTGVSTNGVGRPDETSAPQAAGEPPATGAAGEPPGAGTPGEPREADGPGVVYVEIRPAEMQIALDEILVNLVRQGFKVQEYGRSRTDLEAVFLRLSE